MKRIVAFILTLCALSCLLTCTASAAVTSGLVPGINVLPPGYEPPVTPIPAGNSTGSGGGGGQKQFCDPYAPSGGEGIPGGEGSSFGIYGILKDAAK